VARTRAQRRRHTLLITLALAVSLIVLLFARDVSRSAHNAGGPRRSEDRTFGALANTLLKKENNFDGRLKQLLSNQGALSRVAFASRLGELNGELSSWITTTDQIRRPALAHNINDSLYQITEERVDAYQTLLGDVARTLQLPWAVGTSTPISNPAASLVATAKQWNLDRFALAKEPGLVHLIKLSSQSANYYVTNGSTTIAQAPSLALVRAVGIAALRVSPAPLPAATGILLLPPVQSVELGVSAVNASYDNQPVTLTIRVTPLNKRGNAFVQTMTATLGPLQAYAFIPKSLHTAPSEQANVVITLSGAPAAVGEVTSETYRLEMSPSGNT
jgi:hypothetical protein